MKTMKAIKNNWYILCISALLTCSCSNNDPEDFPPAPLPYHTYAIESKGTVTDSNGTPIEGAEVFTRILDESGTVIETLGYIKKTDTTGKFWIYEEHIDVMPESVRIIATDPMNSEIKDSVDVKLTDNSLTTVTVNIKLNR